MVDNLSAVNAYRNQMKMMQNAGAPSIDESATQPSFAGMVEKALGNAADAAKTGEATEIQALTGNKVELSDLVTAVANAELSLNTVVAVRDRVINAYNDIIRMAI